MSYAATIPDLYKYGILTSRAIGLLSQPKDQPISEDEKGVLTECRELVLGAMRGGQFLFSPLAERPSKIRPEDVETFTYVLSSDSQVKDKAAEAESLQQYFDGIARTLDAIITAGGVPDRAAIQNASDFFARFADSLIETARQNARRTVRHERMSRVSP